MTLKKCPICGGAFVRKREKETLKGNSIGVFSFDECQNCGEKFYFEDIIDAIDAHKRGEKNG